MRDFGYNTTIRSQAAEVHEASGALETATPLGENEKGGR
jgi:hypothetical protein